MKESGLVLKSTGSNYIVKASDQRILNCKLKGNFRIKDLKTTNPITVGDYVFFEIEDGGDFGLISEIKERKNCIIRKATKLSKQSHLLAANIDRAFLIISVKNPCIPLGFIDRFLITAESYKIPTTICFNKIDIYDDKAIELYAEYRAIYESIGYDCIEISALKGHRIQDLHEKLKNSVNLFAGQSGVGKSSIINKLSDSFSIKTSDVSLHNEKGKHTTTFAEMHTLADNTYIIDTPGIREFGLFDFTQEELALYFIEMKALLNQCKFYNCTHLHEPGCAVLEALNNGDIHESRYINYQHMFNDLKK